MTSNPRSEKEQPSSTVVTITDRNFFIAIFTLVLSLKYHRVRTRINVLSVGLTAQQKAWLEQFEDVKVVEADASTGLGPAARKGEAILTAENDDSEYISLLDGDCIATGDITRHLTPPGQTLYARLKTPDEDDGVFATRYDADDVPGTIPRRILATWKTDVGENESPAITNTVCGGNLTVHRSQLPFIEKWQSQIAKVLPKGLQGAHDFGSHAYSQVDESVLNSLLAFAHDAPRAERVQLDVDPDAYVAHLGPNHPKPWVLWRPERLKYYEPLAEIIAWAQTQGYQMPPIPWTFLKRNRARVYLCSYAFALYRACRRPFALLWRIWKAFRKSGNTPHRAPTPVSEKEPVHS